MFRHVLPIMIVTLGFAGSARSTTIHVPGDFPTISQAVAAASAGDSVAVGPGIYTEDATIEIDLPLTIYSVSGAASTVLDGENDRRILYCSSGEIVLRGLSFVRGRVVPTVYSGGAVLIGSGSVVTMEDCVLRDCFADTGGAAHVSASGGAGTTLVARRCRFEGNTASTTAGAAYVVIGATALFEDCAFIGNATQIYAGAVHAHRATMHFEGCVFQANRSGDVAGGLYYGTASAGHVRNCTFCDHTSPGNIAGTIVGGAGTEIAGNIFVGETHGFGVHWYTGEGKHSCNVFWDNASGAMGCGSLTLSEVVADPLFCDAAAGDFTLAANSPCLPGNHPNGVNCGLIGALGQGCGPVALTPQTWARLKARYR
jgi:hypothetical protein